jgi:catechol 2,3-dioxygenase-like lactoylglutathione lyase family enzyme
MKPRITVITLGVDDLERALAFYRDGLGLPTQGIFGIPTSICGKSCGTLNSTFRSK